MSKRHYVLLSTDGYTNLPTSPDLNDHKKESVYIWGFIGGLLSVDDVVIPENSYLDWRKSYNWDNLFKLKGSAKLPSPIIWGEVGDDIYITLINLGMLYRTDILDNHSIHLHGAHVPTQLDGFPETSFGVPVWMPNSKYNCLCSPPTITYYFKLDHPGTLLYNCHVKASEHIQMGMYGALVIYPSIESLNMEGVHQDSDGFWYFNDKLLDFVPNSATNRNFAYNNPYSYYDKEYIILLSDIDSNWHKAIENLESFNSTNFKPNYWLVNGKSFPDTLLPYEEKYNDLSSKDLTQINYNSYVHINTNDKLLLRMINIGYDPVPWYVHGWHFEILGKDSHISPFLSLKTLISSYKHNKISDKSFTINISSGETYDLLIEATDKYHIYESYILNGQDYIQPLCAQIIKLYSENIDCIFDVPTEPVDINDTNTVNYLEICSRSSSKSDYCLYPQFYPMYNHTSYKVTNNGVYPGGQMTYIQIDAPICTTKSAQLEEFQSSNDDTLTNLDKDIDLLEKSPKEEDSSVEALADNLHLLINKNTYKNDLSNTNIDELQIKPIVSEYYLDENSSISDMFDEIKSLTRNDLCPHSNNSKNKSLFEILDELN